MKKMTLGIFILLLLSCSKQKVPVVTEWIGLQTKQDTTLTKLFKTAGDGVGPVSWWAGGYTYGGGSFEIELIDVKAKESVLKQVYRYGDASTGNDEKPRFHWWHSEAKDRILLQADRVYKMTLRTKGLAQPGAGWGLWLYEIGQTPQRQESPER